MAATGFTPIILYHSTTGSAVPSNANLSPGELALNIADMKLYCENSSGTVTLLASGDAAAGNFTTVNTTNLEVTNIKAKDGTAVLSIADSTGVTTQSTPAIISVNSTSDALRITQTGTGNALLVEDSTNPDATPFVVNTDGTTIIGSSSTRTSYISGSAVTPVLQVDGSSANASSFSVTRSNGNPYVFINNASTVASGNGLGSVNFSGGDGTNLVNAARIGAEVDGTPGTNDMPGRLIFSTTADNASSPTERMRIDSAGNVGIGGSTSAGTGIYLNKGITGATTAMGMLNAPVFASDVTAEARTYNSFPSTTAASFTLTGLKHYRASQGTIGAGSAITSQYGYVAESSLTGATNNYGFYSNIASGTGRWNFYANGTADNYFAGSVGIGTTSLTAINVGIGKAITGATQAYGVNQNSVIQSDVTAGGNYYSTNAATVAAAFSLNNLRHFFATQGTIGAGSTVNNQFGFLADSTLTGATNNYGFYGNIASGTGRWNLYMNGTAENYLGGNLKIGGTAARATTAGTNHLSIFNGTAPAGTLTNGVSLYSSSGDFNFMDAAGGAYKVGYRNVPAVGTKTTSYTLQTADVGKYVQIGSGGSITIPDATFSEGDAVSLFNNTTGDITVTCTITTAYIAGADADVASVTLATRGICTIFFISGTVCVITGNIS